MFVFGYGRLWTTVAVALLVAIVLAGCGKAKTIESARPATPEQWKQVEQLNKTADDMYRYVMDGDIDKARAKLEELSAKMTDIRFTGIASVEGVGALSEAIVQAKRALQSVQASPEAGQAAAAKIRLATDALTHANQPMWLDYYKTMKESASRLAQAVQARDKPEAVRQLEQLQLRYGTIRPSLLISKQPSDVEKMDSLFAFLQGQLAKTEIDTKQLNGGLTHLHASLDELFGQTDRAAYVPIVEKRVPLTWVLLLGSIIVAVLSFAAWRIFDFERNSFGGRTRM
ncbi:sporulation protein YpjB [Paenibacillus sp. GYB003]|uniref:sporulation protein YpjB n=1 Tax=Paenibacillus sp. GYB003 TaxID=2994392 RepID=UPI002F965D54